MYFECYEEDKNSDCGSGKWVLKSLWNPKFVLELNNINFPIGSHDWTSKENYALCNQFKGYSKRLTFSQCFPDKFTCTSGHCIDLKNRCNTKYDCKDKSDEEDCVFLKAEKGYAKEVLPVHGTQDPSLVFINVSIIAFPSISTKDVKFTVDFYLNLRWYDPRFKFLNLHSKNRISEKDLEEIWMPKLAFRNSLGPLTTVGSTSGFIIRESDPLEGDHTHAPEGKNIIVFTTYLLSILVCPCPGSQFL